MGSFRLPGRIYILHVEYTTYLEMIMFCLGENTISVIETEERRVRERCYRLFLVWGSRQTDVRTFQSNEIPLELIRRLRNMFQDDLDLMCAQNCLDVLAHYEQTWAQFNSRR